MSYNKGKKHFNVSILLTEEKIKFIAYYDLDNYDIPIKAFNESEIEILDELDNSGVVFYMNISGTSYPKYTGFGIQIRDIIEGKHKVFRCE